MNLMGLGKRRSRHLDDKSANRTSSLDPDRLNTMYLGNRLNLLGIQIDPLPTIKTKSLEMGSSTLVISK